MKMRIWMLICAIMLITGGSISANAAASPVSLSETNITLTVGQSKTITVKSAGKITIKKKTFVSSNDKAVVTKNGKITAKKEGKATINVKITYKKGKKNQTKTLKCNVIIKDNPPVKADDIFDDNFDDIMNDFEDEVDDFSDFVDDYSASVDSMYD